LADFNYYVVSNLTGGKRGRRVTSHQSLNVPTAR